MNHTAQSVINWGYLSHFNQVYHAMADVPWQPLVLYHELI
ncbi:MAG: hypothetical protein FD166_2247 [Bacteroidetes bacterium]|nr:MAG: hypothetical protein FD166_2247 [Bacteroidota bacterium]